MSANSKLAKELCLKTTPHEATQRAFSGGNYSPFLFDRRTLDNASKDTDRPPPIH